ncbi:MAG: hypothetical protein MJ252_07730 [archaeon]|nr:hypothetical protein [archaeon]
MPKKPKKDKEPNDEFKTMTIEQLQEALPKLEADLKKYQTSRNFDQQERDTINNLYEISKDEEKKLKEAIEREERVMEYEDEEHKKEINAFINKFRHLEYDQEMFIGTELHDDSEKNLVEEETTRKKREDIYSADKADLKQRLKVMEQTHTAEIKNEKTCLKDEFQSSKGKLDQRLRDIVQDYKDQMEELRANLELRLKVEIHELEERKNLHILNLNQTFEKRMSDWKNENIKQIKQSIDIIKENIEVLKDLKTDNEKLKKENEELAKAIEELNKKYKEAKDINKQVNDRLAKYYNQAINMKNMKEKIKNLDKKCSDTEKKTEDINKKKDSIEEKIKDLKDKFRPALDTYKEKTEIKNEELKKQLDQLNTKYDGKDEEIERILQNIDIVAGRDAEENQNFNRDMYRELMNKVKETLEEKTLIIKKLKASLAVAAKAFNDTIRVYEAKLHEFGIPVKELGFQTLETNTSLMPAGLVAD